MRAIGDDPHRLRAEREARILAGPGIVAIPGGGDAARLEALLEEQASKATLILSCGIAGALDPTLRAGDVVIDFKPLPFRSSGAVPGRDNKGARTGLGWGLSRSALVSGH